MLRMVLAEEPEHSDALYYLGFLYENGLGTDRDLKTSYRYYSQAVQTSEEQNAKAMFKLGNLLFSGDGAGIPNKGNTLPWSQMLSRDALIFIIRNWYNDSFAHTTCL